MLFSWLKHRRRRRLIGRPLPREWADVLAKNIRQFPLLPDEQRKRVEDKVKVFVAEKYWEGCGGLELNDEIKVTIAGVACLMLAGIEDDYCFDRVKSVLVYPDAYVQPPELHAQPGVIAEPTVNLGESWHRGPVIFSWRHVLSGARGQDGGRNVVVHEMAHKLDELNGETDGMPPQPTRAAADRWRQVAGRRFAQLVQQIQNGAPHFLDGYGATNPTEFFAVASETFFEEPLAMRGQWPDFYELLCEFYHLDPAGWYKQPTIRSEPAGELLPDLEHSIVEGAVRDLAAQLHWTTDRSDDRLLRAALKICGGNCDAALNQYTDTIERDPQDARAYIFRAVVYLAMDQYEEALGDAERALELSADDIDAFRARGLARLAAKRYEAALADCHQVVQRAPHDAEAVFLRALAYAGAGNLPLALEDLNRVVELAPNWAEAYAERSRVHALSGNGSAAEADRRHALQREPALADSL